MTMSGLLRWLNTELWGPMWPNIFAPSAITLGAVAISHIKRTRQAHRHHEDMKAHITSQAKERGE